MTWMWWALPLVGGLLCLALYPRHGAAKVLKSWELLLTPGMRSASDALCLQVDLDAALLDHAHDEAKKARQDAQMAEAVRLLELAYSVVEQATPERLSRLRAMSLCCRMAAAIVPLPPLRPADFQLRRLATGAGLAAAIHDFLFTSAERFRLRLGVLRFGFRLVQRAMRRSTDRLRRSPETAPSWVDFASAKSDFKRLDLDHAQSFRALLASLAAQEALAVPASSYSATD
ncbi:MAG TPA: hypothetical protein VKI41_16535 [Vicinamibacteria bacterium]|nr:hypothetical protein [Vicinamibacteria bacterium]